MPLCFIIGAALQPFQTRNLLPFAIYLPFLYYQARFHFDPGPIVALSIGLTTIGMMFVAIGLFFSALTRNQIIAAIWTFVVLFLIVVIVGGEGSFKGSFVAAMALGIIEECLSLSVQYAKDRVQFGEPIGSFQLIQDKLARMEVARLNVENLVFRTIEMSAAGHSMTLAEASAMKLYSARAATEVAMEAVQLHGGNGYMAEFHVEQLARDAKVLQIYAGTDEIQITHIAKDLLRR